MSKVYFPDEYLGSKWGDWKDFISHIPSTALLQAVCSGYVLIVFWHLKSQPHLSHMECFYLKGIQP